jgi:hypothetical protein
MGDGRVGVCAGGGRKRGTRIVVESRRDGGGVLGTRGGALRPTLQEDGSVEGQEKSHSLGYRSWFRV